MTKQYKFIVLLWIFILMLYLVFSVKYEEYKVKETIKTISDNNEKSIDLINDRIETVAKKSTRAHRNTVFKDQFSRKTKWETVLYITTEAEYEKFTAPYRLELSEIEETPLNPELEGLTNLEKWDRFLFGN
jgi:septal ring-binding cell division protein DamX